MKLDLTNLQQHSISARFSELVDLGVIEEVGERPCKHTGNRVMIYSVTSNLPIKLERKPTRKEKKKEILEKVKTLGGQFANGSKKRKDLAEIYYDIEKL